MIDSDKPRIVVLGGTGMLGHKVFQRLAKSFPGTRCTISASLDDPSIRRISFLNTGDAVPSMNAFDFNKLSSVLRDIRPHFVVNCIGVIKQRKEAASPIPSITINALLPHRLAEVCSEWNGRLIHFSTDCVFSGRRGLYTEGDRSDAEDLYGKTKFLGEVASDHSLTLRTSIIGRELAHHHSLLEWLLSSRGRTINGYLKSIYSGVTTNHLADLVSRIITHHPDLHGLYQVASQPISKCELLTMLRDAYSLDVTILPVDGECVDRSLDGTKLRGAIGYECPPWPCLIAELTQDTTPYGNWGPMDPKESH